MNTGLIYFPDINLSYSSNNNISNLKFKPYYANFYIVYKIKPGYKLTRFHHITGDAFLIVYENNTEKIEEFITCDTKGYTTRNKDNTLKNTDDILNDNTLDLSNYKLREENTTIYIYNLDKYKINKIINNNGNIIDLNINNDFKLDNIEIYQNRYILEYFSEYEKLTVKINLDDLQQTQKLEILSLSSCYDENSKIFNIDSKLDKYDSIITPYICDKISLKFTSRQFDKLTEIEFECKTFINKILMDNDKVNMINDNDKEIDVNLYVNKLYRIYDYIIIINETIKKCLVIKENYVKELEYSNIDFMDNKTSFDKYILPKLKNHERILDETNMIKRKYGLCDEQLLEIYNCLKNRESYVNDDNKKISKTKHI